MTIILGITTNISLSSPINLEFEVVDFSFSSVGVLVILWLAHHHYLHSLASHFRHYHCLYPHPYICGCVYDDYHCHHHHLSFITSFFFSSSGSSRFTVKMVSCGKRWRLNTINMIFRFGIVSKFICMISASFLSNWGSESISLSHS